MSNSRTFLNIHLSKSQNHCITGIASTTIRHITSTLATRSEQITWLNHGPGILRLTTDKVAGASHLAEGSSDGKDFSLKMIELVLLLIYLHNMECMSTRLVVAPALEAFARD